METIFLVELLMNTLLFVAFFNTFDYRV